MISQNNDDEFGELVSSRNLSDLYENLNQTQQSDFYHQQAQAIVQNIQADIRQSIASSTTTGAVEAQCQSTVQVFQDGSINIQVPSPEQQIVNSTEDGIRTLLISTSPTNECQVQITSVQPSNNINISISQTSQVSSGSSSSPNGNLAGDIIEDVFSEVFTDDFPFNSPQISTPGQTSSQSSSSNHASSPQVSIQASSASQTSNQSVDSISSPNGNLAGDIIEDVFSEVFTDDFPFNSPQISTPGQTSSQSSSSNHASSSSSSSASQMGNQSIDIAPLISRTSDNGLTSFTFEEVSTGSIPVWT